MPDRSRIKQPCGLAIFLLGLMAASAGTAQETFSRARLEALALESNQSLLAAREQISAARHAVSSAAAFPNPELEYLAGTTRARTTSGTPGNIRSFTLTQPIDLPGRRASRIGAAEAGVAMAGAQVRGFSAEMVARLRLRYFDLLRRQAELRNAQQDTALVESVRSRIALRVESGESPKYELIKADAESLNAQKIAQAAGFRVEQARSSLRQAVGDALPMQFAVEGSLRDVPELPPLESLRQGLAEVNPELARARAEVLRAERQVDYELAQRWPSLALKAAVDEEPDIRSSQIGMVVSIPIWDRRSGPVGEARAHLTRARGELEAQSFSLVQAMEMAYQQYEIARTQVTALESGIVRQAEAALKVAEAAYRFGERGFLDVLDAQRVFRAARAELITARFELAAAWIEIERLRANRGDDAK